MGDGEHYNPGAALKGHRIAFSTRKLSSKVMQISSGHKGKAGTLVADSYCVIDVPLKVYVEGHAKRKQGK